MNDQQLMSFELHPRLAADTVSVGALPLCRVLLMNDRAYPWCVLVPQRANLREIHDLPLDLQSRLIMETSAVAKAMQVKLTADKMNIAALGNQVPQLHVHVIARYENDPAWPQPVWGKFPPQPYPRSEREAKVHSLRNTFASLQDFRSDF